MLEKEKEKKVEKNKDRSNLIPRDIENQRSYEALWGVGGGVSKHSLRLSQKFSRRWLPEACLSDRGQTARFEGWWRFSFRYLYWNQSVRVSVSYSEFWRVCRIGGFLWARRRMMLRLCRWRWSRMFMFIDCVCVVFVFTHIFHSLRPLGSSVTYDVNKSWNHPFSMRW